VFKVMTWNVENVFKPNPDFGPSSQADERRWPARGP
jgi:hypothetical protein